MTNIGVNDIDLKNVEHVYGIKVIVDKLVDRFIQISPMKSTQCLATTPYIIRKAIPTCI